jgi:hypothetical protein
MELSCTILEDLIVKMKSFTNPKQFETGDHHRGEDRPGDTFDQQLEQVH